LRRKPAGYDSKFEKTLDNGPLSVATYHPKRIRYVIPEREAWYEPDWTYKDWVIEGKGRFRSHSDAGRYLHIRKSVEKDGKRFIFVFMNPSLPMPGAKRRRNGSKLSHKEWAEKHGFEWATPETIGDIIVQV
jgi:hypothetical protein